MREQPYDNVIRDVFVEEMKPTAAGCGFLFVVLFVYVVTVTAAVVLTLRLFGVL